MQKNKKYHKIPGCLPFVSSKEQRSFFMLTRYQRNW